MYNRLDLNFNEIVNMIETRRNNAYKKVNEELVFRDTFPKQLDLILKMKYNLNSREEDLHKYKCELFLNCFIGSD